MKTLLVSLSVLFGLSLSALADDGTDQNHDPQVTFRSVVASKYLAFGSGGMLYDKPAIQSDLFLSFHDGLYLDLWHSAPFRGYNHNFGTEQDFGVGWSGPLSALGLKSQPSDTTLDIGVTYFDEPSLSVLGAQDIIYSHVKLSKAFKWTTINGCYENYVAMPSSPYRGGSLFSAGASNSASFFKDLTSASVSLSLVYDTGGFGLDSGLLFRGSVELDWKLSKRLTMVMPQVNYYVPVTVHDSRPSFDKVVFGGLGYQF
jgi:hypothetical protein